MYSVAASFLFFSSYFSDEFQMFLRKCPEKWWNEARMANGNGYGTATGNGNAALSHQLPLNMHPTHSLQMQYKHKLTKLRNLNSTKGTV